VLSDWVLAGQFRPCKSARSTHGTNEKTNQKKYIIVNFFFSIPQKSFST
jgi:hypothetical protein